MYQHFQRMNTYKNTIAYTHPKLKEENQHGNNNTYIIVSCMNEATTIISEKNPKVY